MDTPVKNRSASTPSTSSPNPAPQVEDSPIFNYINDLSPIKPPRTAQSVSLLNFGSPKTPVNSLASLAPQKSVLGSTSSLSYPLNHERLNTEKEGDKSQVAEVGVQPVDLHVGGDHLGSCVGATTDAHNKLPDLKSGGFQSTNDECTNSKVAADNEQDYPNVIMKVTSQPDEQTEFPYGLRQCIGNDHGGCDYQSDAFKCKSMSHTEDSRMSPPFFIQEDHIDSCTLSFMENILQFSDESTDDIQEMEPIPFLSYEEHGVNASSAHPNTDNLCETGEASTSFSVVDRAAPSARAEVNNKARPQQKQMLPRRSLIFEMSGNHYRKLKSDTGGTSSVSEQPAHTAVTSERQLVSNKCGDLNLPSVRSGIGLHLNALASTSRDKIVVKQEVSTYRRKLISVPCTTSSFHPTSSDPKPIHPASKLNPMGKGLEPGREKESVSQRSVLTGSGEFKQTNTKKKRGKSGNVAEGDSCKRCNCKRSKCLKLYCECFAAGLYCVDPCSCQGCLNKPAFEETVLETRKIIEARNPLAFAPKVIKIPGASEHGDEHNTTPASARHKRGCNCKKSGCLKKYCECFQGGVGCSVGCRCEGCRNSFGRKGGADNILLGAGACEDNPADASFPDQDPQATPRSKIGRNTCGSLTLTSQFPPISTSLLHPCTKHALLKTTPSFHDNSTPTTPHEAATNDVDNDAPTSTSVKSASPKSRRVMPGHEPRHSPPRKFSRKLILRSIPSLPKLS